MLESYRSGNSRVLAKTLDQLGHPLAVLDRRGAIAYANAPLCAMVKGDATLLVGKQCSWQIAPDASPFSSLLTALAPPAGALQGRIVTRRLSTPIVFGSVHTGQLFVPLLDIDGTVEATVVVLGNWNEINAQLPMLDPLSAPWKRIQETTLGQIRSRWSTLDGLHALIGSSPAVELAMVRAQLAMSQACSLLVSGPRGTGKTEIVRGIFLGRLKKVGMNKIAGQLFPLNCSLLETELLEGMLDVWTGRLKPEGEPVSQLLLLEQLEDLTLAGVERVNAWLDDHGRRCTVAATSRESVERLASRSADWRRLVSRLAVVEIVLPALSERREDIPLLATHLLAYSCQQKSRAPLTITPETLQLLTAFPWRDNLTQLAQAIDEAVNHAVLVASIQVVHLPVAIRTLASTLQVREGGPAGEGGIVEPIELDQVLLELERTMLRRALKLSPRNRAQAARSLGISRARLLRRIEQLGLGSD